MGFGFIQGNTGTNSAAFLSNNTAGSLLIAVASAPGAPTLTVSDSQGNTWIPGPLCSIASAPAGQTYATFYALNVNAGANTVSVANAATVSIAEYSVLSGTVFDVSNAMVGSAFINSGTVSISTQYSSELLIGAWIGLGTPSGVFIQNEQGIASRIANSVGSQVFGVNFNFGNQQRYIAFLSFGTSGGGGVASHVITDSGSVTSATVTNFPATQPVSGSVSVSNFPATQPVSGTVAATQGTSPWVTSLASTTITGSVAVTLPAGQAVELLDGGGANKASISASGAVKVDGSAATQPVSGSVSVSNFPATQPVSGSVSVSNFPATQPISGTVTSNQGTAAASTAGWSTTGANVAESSATWTNATTVNTALAITVKGYTTATVVLTGTGTVTPGVVTFEATDDTAATWQNIVGALLGQSANQPAQSSFTLATSVTFWQFNIAGFSQFRVRLSTAITGAGSELVGIQAGTGLGSGPIPVLLMAQNESNGVWNSVGNNTGSLKSWILGSTGQGMDAIKTAGTAPNNGLLTLVENVTTAPSLTTGQTVAIQADYVGSQFVKPYRRSQTVGQATTIASTTGATTVLAAQAAGIFADISNLIITITPIAVTAVAVTATLSDGSLSYIFDLDSGVVAAGGSSIINANFNPPLPASSVATPWTIALSVSTVTVHVTVVAVLQKAS